MKNNDTGLKLFDVIQVVFLILRIAGIVDWSWWFVMSPTLFILILLIFAGILEKTTS